MTSALAIAALLLVAAPEAGVQPAGKPASAAAAQLEVLKKLAGTWTGRAEADGADPFDASVEYRVTAHGTAVIETQFPGTPHEMVTVYHLDGDQLLLTHYCAAGNQPTMRALPSTDPNVIAFDFLRGSNMKPADMHMHSARIAVGDDGHLRAEWTSWKDGKAVHVAKFALARQR